MYGEQKTDFVEKLQALDDNAKRNIVIGGSILVMGVVVIVWLGYFNGIVNGRSQSTALNTDALPPPAAAPAPAAMPAAPVAASPAGPSMWQNVVGGFASIGNIFNQPHTYQIKPNSN
jgi:hypothetical protein